MSLKLQAMYIGAEAIRTALWGIPIDAVRYALPGGSYETWYVEKPEYAEHQVKMFYES